MVPEMSHSGSYTILRKSQTIPSRNGRTLLRKSDILKNIVVLQLQQPAPSFGNLLWKIINNLPVMTYPIHTMHTR